ncbi:hypothetical protein GE09DRAFT_1063016 [Coniochaeta sp. 2T2.1]|nr:hypothetical protein GE09DRAFT_1063016 [Coniochaeta sp. 2T2.1]
MDSIMSLPVLRQNPDEKLHVWLDKLCINQGDHEDIVAHLGIMDAIYHAARRVVILLEDVQLSGDEEQAGLAFARFYVDLCQEVLVRGLEGEEKGRFVKNYFPWPMSLAR